MIYRDPGAHEFLRFFRVADVELVAENRICLRRGERASVEGAVSKRRFHLRAGYRTAGFVIRMSAYKTVNKRADPKRNFRAPPGCNSGAVVAVAAADRGREDRSRLRREIESAGERWLDRW